MKSAVKTISDRDLRVQEITTVKLSPWLAAYQWFGSLDSIEIPGQYSGNVKPHPERHTKVVKVEHKLALFRSVRRPMRLTILGSDGNRHHFIVKYGEDLRQDERIEQLLNVMNHKLRANATCRAQNLHLITYAVIPISEYCGLLSWVPNTSQFAEVISASLYRRTREKFLTVKCQMQTANRKNMGPAENDAIAFGTYATQPQRVLETNYRAIANLLSEDTFKLALQVMATSYESYYMLRNNFGRSLAVMSIAHWILGIGDRHTEK